MKSEIFDLAKFWAQVDFTKWDSARDQAQIITMCLFFVSYDHLFPPSYCTIGDLSKSPKTSFTDVILYCQPFHILKMRKVYGGHI